MVQALLTKTVSSCRGIIASVLCLFISFNTDAQSSAVRISYTFPQGSCMLGTLLATVEQQSDTAFAYDRQWVPLSTIVEVPPGNTIDEVIGPVLDKLGFKLSRLGLNIAIRPKFGVTSPTPEKEQEFKIYVSSPEYGPLDGATVNPIDSSYRARRCKTNKNGYATLKSPLDSLPVIISHASMEPQKKILTHKDTIKIVMQLKSDLSEVEVKSYFNTPKRMYTGDVVILPEKQLFKFPNAPVLNMLSALIPGAQIAQTSGIPSSSERFTLRGPTSLFNGSDPLIVVNNVPYGPNNQSVTNATTGVSGSSISSLLGIDPAGIERMDLLKDADATAIYGPKGANGVLLITTRQANPGNKGQLKWNVDASASFTSTAQLIKMMNGPQYLQLRRDAYRLDTLTPDWQHAPDLFLTDTTKYKNWTKALIGRPAYGLYLNTSVSGGDSTLAYLAGMSNLRENSVMINQPVHDHFSTYFNANGVALKHRLSYQAHVMYDKDDDHQFTGGLDPTVNTTLVPFDLHVDRQVDANDRPLAKFGKDGDSVDYTNLLTNTRKSYHSEIHNFITDLLVRFKMGSFTFINNSGWNIFTINEYSLYPKNSLPPSISSDITFFATTRYTSVIEEPQLEYRKKMGNLNLLALGGISFQQIKSGMSTSANGAPTGKDSAGITHKGEIGRANLTWKYRYILNLTFRRDGSSRLSPDKQYKLFWALGSAWIFSDEPWIDSLLPGLSFGKLRFSYGITGNDQIGGGHFLNAYSPTALINPQNSPGWISGSNAGPGQTWETARKLEAGLELGFFNNRVQPSFAWYRNRSSSQLVPDKYDVWWNKHVVLENSGWEFTLDANLIRSRKLQWVLSFNLTLPASKLISFPDLEELGYKDALIVGRPVNDSKMYKFLSVDPQKGIYKFQDVNRDNKLDSNDQIFINGPRIKAYGGLRNSVELGHFRIDLLIDFRVQTGINPLGKVYGNTAPGNSTYPLYSNQPVFTLDYWKKPGDLTSLQRASTGAKQDVANAIQNFLSSDGMIVNSSYMRIKAITLTYQLTSIRFVKSASVYASALNLLTFTSYKGIVETEDIRALPPLRIISVGFRTAL